MSDVQPSKKVLIIDDDPVQLTMLDRMLTQAGLKGVQAECGQAGLDYLESEQGWLAVLLDLALPDMPGMDVLLSIREKYRPGELPVLVLSGNQETQTIVEALLTGANDYIVKSQDTSILLARLNVSLALHQQFDQLIDEEQYRVMRETIGAACHHISQPLTVATAELDLMLGDPDITREALLEGLHDLQHAISQSKDQIHRLHGARTYKTTEYVGKIKILDIENQD